MGASYPRSPSIAGTAPPGSRLSDYARYLESSGDPEPQWESASPEMRPVLAFNAIQEEPRLWMHSFEFVRACVVVPVFEKMGMPKGPRPAWLETLLDDETDLLRFQDPDDGRAHPGRKPGRPKEHGWPLSVIWAAYVDELTRAGSGAPENSVHEAVARRLGPGVSRHQVRRAGKAFRRRLGSADPEWRDLILLATNHLIAVMREFDRTSPTRPRRVSKPTVRAGCY